MLEPVKQITQAIIGRGNSLQRIESSIDGLLISNEEKEVLMDLINIGWKYKSLLEDYEEMLDNE